MLTALLLALSFNGYDGGTPITCDFPAEDAAGKSIRVVLEPRPSLKDQPGLYRVFMDFDGLVSVRAAAQPISATAERDILIRGITRKNAMYSIGLRDDGIAAFNIQPAEGDSREKSTRLGECHGHKAHIDRWLSMW